MLHIFLGQKQEAFPDISGYFDLMFEDSWIDNDLSKEMILGVDNSIVVHPHVIESPVLGPITPRELSGGVKGLILMAFDTDLDGRYFYGQQFGENTLPYMLKIARTKDVYVALAHFFNFPRDMTDTIYIDNTNTKVTGFSEWVDAYCSTPYSDRITWEE